MGAGENKARAHNIRHAYSRRRALSAALAACKDAAAFVTGNSEVLDDDALRKPYKPQNLRCYALTLRVQVPTNHILS